MRTFTDELRQRSRHLRRLPQSWFDFFLPHRRLHAVLRLVGLQAFRYGGRFVLAKPLHTEGHYFETSLVTHPMIHTLVTSRLAR